METLSVHQKIFGEKYFLMDISFNSIMRRSAQRIVADPKVFRNEVQEWSAVSAELRKAWFLRQQKCACKKAGKSPCPEQTGREDAEVLKEK